MAKLMNFTCPTCGARILHETDNGRETEYEVCGSCLNRYTIAQLQANVAGGAQGVGNAAPVVTAENAAVTYIDTAESAMAYLENLYETFEWDDFLRTSQLSIPSVDRMLEKILMKNAANPAAWELQFTAVSTPLLKKLDGLKKLEKQFFDEYVKADDMADCFVYFDAYAKAVNTIIASGGRILKTLETAIKYYKKYNGAAAVQQQMTAQLEYIRERVAALNPVKDYKALEGFEKAKLGKQAAISARFAARGVDVESVYTQATALLNAGGDCRSALAAFRSIAGYKDATEYANRIDGWLDFPFDDGTLIKLGRKHYVLREETTPVLDLRKLKAVASSIPQDDSPRFSVYEIVHAKQATEPCITGLTSIVTCFGGYMIYCKNGSQLYVFNGNAINDAVANILLLNSRAEDFEVLTRADGKTLIGNNKIFVKLKINTEQTQKQGCLVKLFKKTPTQRTNNGNNFRLLSLDLVNNRADVVVPELIDVQDAFGDVIFFNKVASFSPTDTREAFYAYNVVTNETRAVLDAESEIVDVVDGKVVYFLWSPNDYNKDLYTLDLKSGQKKLLEKNAFDYYGQIDGMVYYYVGNDNCKTLYRIATDGTAKKEIRGNAEYFDRVLVQRNGWLYLLVGYGINATLAKMSPDGEKFVTLCPQFDRLVEIRDGYVYYVNLYNELCVVREDGSERKIILEDVGNFVQVTRDAIFLLRREYVDDAYVNHSLYKVDFEGRGLEKVAFDVNAAVFDSSDKNKIYLYKTDSVTFSIAVPVDAKNYDTTFETKTVKTITVYDIEKKTFAEIAVFGKPDVNSYTFKRGCLKKSVKKDAVVKEIPNKRGYKRTGKYKAGDVGREQTVATSAPLDVPADTGGKPRMRTKFTVSKSSIAYLVIAVVLLAVSVVIL